MGRITFIVGFWVLVQLFSFNGFGQINSAISSKHSNIHTVYLAPKEEKYIIKQNPVISIEKQDNWFIHFDDLDPNYKNYFLRIVHCNKDFIPSPLNEIEYLSEFNDLPVRNYEQSNGTKVPYKHFEVPLPKASLSGNYVAILYSNRNKQDTVFAVRYSLVNNQANIFSKISFANQNAYRKSHQSFQLTFNYTNQLIINDESNLKVKVRKVNSNSFENLKLDQPIHNVQDRTVSYQFFGQDGIVPGGNEYRMIDLRSSQQRLSYVGDLNQQGNITQITTFPENAQGNYPYVQRNDINGGYLITNYENPQNILYADYVNCIFKLKASPRSNAPIYLSGGFTNFIKNDLLKLDYDPSTGYYEKKLLLKQGIYNYKFVSEEQETNDYLEGNHAQTENEYEVLIYFQQPGTRYDSLIGYQPVRFP